MPDNATLSATLKRIGLCASTKNSELKNAQHDVVRGLQDCSTVATLRQMETVFVLKLMNDGTVRNRTSPHSRFSPLPRQTNGARRLRMSSWEIAS